MMEVTLKPPYKLHLYDVFPELKEKMSEKLEEINPGIYPFVNALEEYKILHTRKLILRTEEKIQELYLLEKVAPYFGWKVPIKLEPEDLESLIKDEKAKIRVEERGWEKGPVYELLFDYGWLKFKLLVGLDKSMLTEFEEKAKEELLEELKRYAKETSDKKVESLLTKLTKERYFKLEELVNEISKLEIKVDDSYSWLTSLELLKKYVNADLKEKVRYLPVIVPPKKLKWVLKPGYAELNIDLEHFGYSILRWDSKKIEELKKEVPLRKKIPWNSLLTMLAGILSQATGYFGVPLAVLGGVLAPVEYQLKSTKNALILYLGKEPEYVKEIKVMFLPF